MEERLRALRLPADRHARRSRTPSCSCARRASGSDVVQKEMYTFTDRGGRSLTLRPEAPRRSAAPTSSTACTASRSRRSSTRSARCAATAARSGAATASTGSFRSRRSAPTIPAIDAEVIQLYAELLRRLGVTDYVLELNSIGDRNCRPAYIEELHAGSTSTSRSSTRRLARNERRRRSASST